MQNLIFNLMKALWHEQRTWSLAQASQEVPRAYDAWKAPLFRSSYGSVDLWWFIEQFLVILETWVSWGSSRSTNTFDKGKGLILPFLPTGGHRILPQGVKKETSSQPLSVSSFLLSYMVVCSTGVVGHWDKSHPQQAEVGCLCSFHEVNQLISS